MSYGAVQELAIIEVAEPGVPNRERIVLRPTQATDLNDFLVVVGWRPAGAGLIPFDVYYPGQHVVQPPSWVFIFTGPGTNRTEVAANGEVLHIFHMGRPKTIFIKGVAPAIMKIAAVNLGEPAKGPDMKPKPPAA